ncbi:DNA-binding helix-turn-helix protein [[Clostridium] methylpentosum DSM 5476]|uniref:DNA-binding helix-turn-helix protein n=1 Tax=[Clostridium] methylpentosum DSM 5476 TaxID=537013 RepID=C0EJ64_9FIRM|nr:DNA-binding helix-turn-helix protein [[Clostridium] methylpentosum DSM 5476]MDY3988619.1 helix-turn-helix domain-containing protein [Massilioclostridium sp.]MEE1492700.1 helix-turn-helix domain-containing protein [Massilioclostridium sp.]
MRFGDKIKNLRTDADLKQKEVAEILKVSRSSISSYEQNKNQPDLHAVIELAKLFNVSTDYLLGLSEYKTSWVDETECISTNSDNVKIVELLNDIKKLDKPDVSHLVELINIMKNQNKYLQSK